MAEREFKIVEVKEVQLTNGQSFNAYKTIAKQGKKMDVRFVKTCKNIPTEPCVIVVNEDDVNVDTTKQYPVLWVKNVIEIKPLERRNNISDYFD